MQRHDVLPLASKIKKLEKKQQPKSKHKTLVNTTNHFKALGLKVSAWDGLFGLVVATADGRVES